MTPDPTEGPVLDALLLLATEWWKSTRRLLRLAAEGEPGGPGGPGRIERERAQATYASRRIGAALAALDIRMVDHDGQPFSPALPAEPVNPEDFGAGDNLAVAETLEPTILRAGRILRRGKVVLRPAKG